MKRERVKRVTLPLELPHATRDALCIFRNTVFSPDERFIDIRANTCAVAWHSHCHSAPTPHSSSVAASRGRGLLAETERRPLGGVNGCQKASESQGQQVESGSPREDAAKDGPRGTQNQNGLEARRRHGEGRDAGWRSATDRGHAGSCEAAHRRRTARSRRDAPTG